MVLLISIGFILANLIVGNLGSIWTYENSESNRWADEYPSCNGTLQSPINIVSSKAIYYPGLRDFSFNHFNDYLTFNVSNNGHTVIGYELDNEKVRPFVNGSNLGTEPFYLRQFHFHWGSGYSSGSEHQLDGVSFPLELHLMHESKSGLVTVLAFLYQISEHNNPNLDALLKLVDDDFYQDSWDFGVLRLSDMLPDLSRANLNGYFRYIGSLTTPPCTEDVMWNVFRATVGISVSQMESFQKNFIKENHRDVQELNWRNLFVSTINLKN